MNDRYLLSSDTARKLYKSISSLPIIDYHCHLSPKEIYEDKVFSNIGEMWLGGDHYKWRLMRSCGIDENYITGRAGWGDKFKKYASAIEFSAGNPLYHWSHMELEMFFGIGEYLNSDNAADIYKKANKYIKDNSLSPRKLIKDSNVEVICTTDDITDSLEYHKLIREDSSFDVKVLPSFRTDRLLLTDKPDYLEYISKLAKLTGVEIDDLATFKYAIENRLLFFCENGCKFSDIGIPSFPSRIADEEESDESFKKVLSGEGLTEKEYSGFIGNMYVFLAQLYKKYDLVMQWHLAVYRNSNSTLYEKTGADCGVDTVGNPIDGNSLIMLLDAINKDSGMPKTIIYTLNPSNAEQIASIAGAFPNIRLGAAWWFCDHKRGIREQMEVISENSSIGTFLGMLTDSRSFLSYARHDYFRRILSSMIAEWVDGGEYDPTAAEKLAKKIAYENLTELL